MIGLTGNEPLWLLTVVDAWAMGRFYGNKRVGLASVAGEIFVRQ